MSAMPRFWRVRGADDRDAIKAVRDQAPAMDCDLWLQMVEAVERTRIPQMADNARHAVAR